MKLDYLKDKRILILGFAREGQDTRRFLRRLFPGQVFGVADRLDARRLTLDARKTLAKDKKLKRHFGQDYLKKIGDYDIIIKSPGIPPQALRPLLKKNQIITSQADLFFEGLSGQIVGVTGTKGKSTTSALIYEVLKAGGLKAHLVGNIGEPVLHYLSKSRGDDVYVYELSSHQLMDLKKSPHVAVFLNFYPEHRDYYKNLGEYRRAKQNICRRQGKGDYFLFNPENRVVKASVKLTKAKKIALDTRKTERFLRKSNFRGRLDFHHWKLSLAAAIEVGRIFQIPEAKIARGLKQFRPLPHRLEFVGEFRGIRFYNDSLATIPEATLAALKTLGPDVQTIFLGGFDRGLNFRELAEMIVRGRLQNLVFFPTSGQRIWAEIQAAERREKRYNEKRRVFFVKDMKEAVRLVFRHTASGKVCLLSCASPSFGLFRDYRERGDLFKKYVRAYGQRESGKI